MTTQRLALLSAALMTMFIGALTPVRAQVNVLEPDPSVWLRQIYDLYHREEKADTANAKASFDLVVQRASKPLAALFKKDSDCNAKGQGVCALDWDFVIDGQDWALSNVKVGPTVVAGDKATVTVSFKNMTSRCVNVYYFSREDGRWKVDDIETKTGADKPIRIAKILKDYDYSQ